MKEDPVFFLMANLGSEVTRLFRAREEGNGERMRGAYTRACEIVHEIQALPSDKGVLHELLIFQEVLDDAVCEKPYLRIRLESVKNYFLPFALRVMSV